MSEEYLDQSPKAKLSPPMVGADPIQPFTHQQIIALLQSTRRSKYPRRDEAIVRFLLDTGVRVTELCELRMKNVDLYEGQAYVLGKGNKHRTACFGRKTSRALRKYLQNEERMPDDPLFLSERGENASSKFTR